MQGMIHHHAQALLMTSLVRERSAAEPPAARQAHGVSQETEIETIERWLIARDEKRSETAEDHRTGHGPGAGLMPGMVSAGKIDRLDGR